MIKLTLTLLLLFIFSSCGSLNIEKRKHTKGFYLSSSKRTQKVEKTIPASISEAKDKIENSSFAIAEEKILTEPIINDSIINAQSKICDTIVLRNGAILSVHILEKTDSTLMYSLCEGDDDSEIIIPVENVKLIKYKEGRFEVLSQKNDTSKNKYVKPKKNKSDQPTKNKYDKPTKEQKPFDFIMLTILGSIGLTILAGILLVFVLLFTHGTLLSLLFFLIVAFSFYLFLLMIFRNKEKPKFLLFYALLFGVPFGIMAHFIF